MSTLLGIRAGVRKNFFDSAKMRTGGSERAGEKIKQTDAA
jgi:hypothetical protein